MVVFLAFGCGKGTSVQDPGTPETRNSNASTDFAKEETERIKKELDQLREKNSTLQRRLDDTTRESNEIVSKLMDDLAASEREVTEFRQQEEAGVEAENEYDVIRFRTGREIVCRVVAFEENVFQIALNNGAMWKARADDVESIRISTGSVEERAAAGPDTSSASPSLKTPEQQTTAPENTPEEAALVLSAFWNVKIPASSQKIKDLQMLFSNYGSPQKDLSAHPDIEIFKGITYLTPLAAAEEVLSVKLAEVKAIDFGPYPKNCFRYHQYKGNFGSLYNRLNIVTDSAGQVVAIQLVDTNPEQYGEFPSTADWRDLHQPGRSVAWHLINLVDGRHKGASRATVRFATGRPRAGVVGVAGEFRTSKGDVSERSILYLAQPVVDLILLTIRDVY